MELEGVVDNGVIVPDAGFRLPQGTRVRFEVIEEFDEDDIDLIDENLPDDHPDAPYDREKELAILRESIAEMKAGGGRPFEEVMAEIAAKHGLPSLNRE